MSTAAAPSPRTTLRASPDAESAFGRRYLLVVGDGIAATHALPGTGEVALGRGPDCDVSIDHPTISRRHAVLRMGPPLSVEDLGSVNGTCVQGERIPPQRPTPVRAGEVVYLGSTMVVVQWRETPPRPPRLLTHVAFETRLVHECARTAEEGARFAVVRLRAARRVSPVALEAALLRAVRPVDVLAYYAPGEYEVLLPGVGPAETEAATARLRELAGDPGRIAVVGCPGDARGAEPLLVELSRRLAAAAASSAAAGPGPAASPGGAAMAELHTVVERVARSTLSVLVRGETGVGKERMAELVHRLSPRRDQPLLRLNCAALSESLLQSELFGHERGAFTGASGAKPGLLETANGGSVFLDEVGDLPASIQAKLLRVIEDRRVLRIGSVEARPMDVRFIAATNRDLEQDVASGAFRRDLYFRLDGVSLLIPPLRERVAEIDGLARELAVNACRKWGYDTVPVIVPEAFAKLRSHAWPGNIRELRNVIERAVLLCGGEVRPEHLRLVVATTVTTAAATTVPARPVSPAETGPPRRTVDDAEERQRVVEALERCAGNQTQAARLLGVSRRTIVNRLNALGLPRPRKPSAPS